MRATKSVEMRQKLGRSEPLAIHRNGIAPLIVDLNLFGLARCPLRRHGHLVDVLGRGFPGILQNAPFVACMKQVGVHTVRLGLGRGHRDRVAGCEFYQLTPGPEGPFPPGCDDGHARVERHVRQLKPDLVIALARGPVRDGIGPFLPSNVDLALGDEGPGDGGAQEIAALIHGIAPQHGKHVLFDEDLPEVLHPDLRRSDRDGFGFDRLEVFSLPKIRAKGHHGAAVGLLEPPEDHGRVQATRVR